jgi:hypothetical protein
MKSKSQSKSKTKSQSKIAADPAAHLPPIDPPAKSAISPSSGAHPPLPAADPDQPYWAPAGVDLNDWPPQLRADVVDIINPTYRELVVRAKPGLAQSTGITIVHLLWLEILDHLELNRDIRTAMNPPDAWDIIGMSDRPKKIERHLNLVEAKLKASDLLLRLKQFKSRWVTQRKSECDVPYRNLSAFSHRLRKPGKK